MKSKQRRPGRWEWVWFHFTFLRYVVVVATVREKRRNSNWETHKLGLKPPSLEQERPLALWYFRRHVRRYRLHEALVFVYGSLPDYEEALSVVTTPKQMCEKAISFVLVK